MIAKHSLTLTKLSLLVFIFIFILPKAFAQNRSADSLALKAMYDNMGGASWTNNAGWPGPGPINTWEGVGFDGSRVVSLSLGAVGLSGAVPVEIGNMDALQQLYLNENQITTIPDEIGNLTSLIELQIGDNQLTALPAGLGSLSGLNFLSAGNNQLSTLPNEISNLISLTTLELDFNQITSLPSVIDGLTSLIDLQLDGNQLSTLPVEFFNISSLRTLDLEENQFTSVPSGISGLAFLERLDFGGNQLTGAFPADVLLLDSLRELNLARNQLSGSIPTGISNFSKLTQLTLPENQFTGNIPTIINTLVFLEILEVGNNQLSGNIPMEIGSLDSLRFLDLSVNNFDGPVPASFTGLSNLETLAINDNALTGFPDLTSLTNLSEVYLSGNFIPDGDILANNFDSNINQSQFTNAIPFGYNVSSSTFGYSTLSAPTSVTLNDDSVTFTGIPIGFDFDFFGSTYSSIFISSNGFISFQSPDQNGDANPDNEVDGCCNGQKNPLSLYPNAYIAGYWEDLDPTQGGTIQYENLGSEFIVEFNGVPHLDRPETVSFQIKLIEGNNNIEIHCSSCPSDSDSEVTTQGIEDEFGFQGFTLAGRSADVFDLTSDAILFAPEGPAINETDSLALVALYNSTNGASWTNSANWLSGTVDTWFGVTITNGRVSGIDLGSNNLDGPLPDEIGDLAALETLDLAINLLSGSIPTTISSLVSLTDINLLGNALTGTIPSEINDLIGLTSIQLQTNQFSGAIPDFSNLTDLTNLAIGGNMLSGQIPEYIGSLQNLNQLFLGGNELTGNVPDTLGALTNLTFLRLDNNQLSDSIPSNFVNLVNVNLLFIHNNSFTHLPDLSTLSSLSNFNVSDNFFTFEDLEPNSSVITDNTSQQHFGVVQNITFMEGELMDLDAQLPGSGINDIYQWQLDGVDIAGAINEVYSKTANLSDTGIYRLKVTNSSVAGIEIFSEDIIVTIEGTPDAALVDAISNTEGKVWKIAPIEGALKVGPSPNDGSFFSSTLDDITTRDCFFDDTYTFFDDGTFIIDIQGQTYVETWQGDEFTVEECNDPAISSLNDYNLLGGGTFSFDLFNTAPSNLRVNGKGAYLGLPKAYNGDEYSTTLDSLRDSVVYEVFSYTEDSLVLTIDVGGAFWTFSFFYEPPIIPVLESDSLALVAIYNSTDGANWFDNTNWLQPGSFVEQWSGITAQEGRVTEILLEANNLIGSLPSEIGDLDSLRVINMGDNGLSSGLPIEFYNLTSLEGLYLFNNSLTGDLSQFSSLTNLTEFYINGNQLTGTIPADLNTLTSLEQLGLSNNQLEGILPEELSNLTSLIDLFVDDNINLSGEVSLSFTSTNLEAFKVNGTGICEPGLSQYQDWINTLSNYVGSDISCPQTVLASDSLALVAIYNATLGENWVNNENWLQPGSFVSQWSGVTVLDGRVVGLDLNSFGVSGGLPAELGDLDALEVLGAAFNQITSLPDELSQLTNLVSLYLDNNQIEGEIPLAIGSLVNLEEMYMQGNQLSGIIPDTLSNLLNLRALWLSQNKLSGAVPDVLTALSALQTLNLSENRISSIPSDLSGMLSLVEFNLSQNDLDTISATLSIPDDLITLNLRGNALREAPDLTNPNLVDYNVENNRIPFSKLLTFSNTSGLGGQNNRYEIEVDNLLPSVGESLTISMTSSDNVDNTFQWHKNGIPIDGEISENLILASLNNTDAGVYHVEVGNNLLPGVTTFSEQFELEFGVTVKEYAISAVASSVQKANSLSEIETLGFPNSYSQDDTRAWKPSESDSSPTITVEIENATSFNTLWMSVNSNGNWQSTNSYSIDGTTFTEFPIGFSNTRGPGNNLLRWDFETIAEEAKFIRFELDSAQSISFNTSIDAIAIGLNDFTVNRPQDLILSQVVSETIINIAWSGSDFGGGVVIERAINSEAFQVIDTAFATEAREPRSYSDRNAPASDSIFYRVRAFDASEFSEYSNTLELINCPTPTIVNTDNYWFGDADPNSFTGANSPQSEIVVRQIDDNSYNISDIAGGYMDLVAIGFEYYPIEANFTFDCTGEVSEVEFLSEPGVGCGDGGLEFLGSTYFPGNDSIVFNLRWISCSVDFNSYLVLTNVPVPEEVVPVQEPAIVKSISQPDVDKIQITWEDINQEEEFYLIERSIDVDNNFILIDSVGQLNKSNDDPNDFEIVLGVYLDEDVSGGSTFYYRLITRNSTGDSDYSDTLNITKQSNLAFERLLNDPSVSDISNFSYSGYWGDYDLDGDQDLYVQNWQKSSDPFYVAPNNYFYDNNGDGTFTKVENGLTEKATQSRAGSWGDMDNDGDLDFVLQLTQNEVNKLGAFLLLYENDNGTFIETILGEPTSGGFDHVVLGDFDNDGFLDILSKAFVYFNEGGLSFTETSFETLFPEKTATSEPNAHAIDIDLDMDLDIYFGGDQASYLYINNGDRTFSRSSELGSDDIGHRGGAWGDYDNDGDFDLFITLERKPNFNSFRYYRNEGGGLFQLLEPADLGLDVLNLQRGATTIDYNNDGLLDVLSYETSQGNLVILENIGSGQFQKLEDPSFTPTNSLVSAVSVVDYDQDGKQDFFVASGFNSNQSNYIYRNAGSGNNYLRVDLEGTISNKNGIGAVINVFATGVPDQTHQVVSINGTWAGNEQTAHFGLGSSTQADSVIVNWPSGVVTILKDVESNQVIDVMELGIPEVTFDSLALYTEEFRPELFGSVNDTSATIQIELQGQFYDAVNNMDSTWTLAAATVDSLFNGTYEVIARATNIVGVGVDTAMLVIDQSAPFVSINELISTERSPELTGFVDDTTATVLVIIEENDYPATVNTSDSTWSLAQGIIQPPLEDGTYDILALAENRFGVASDTTINELRLDATAPEVFVDNIGTSITSPELTGFISDTTASIIINVAGRGDFTPTINNADSTWFIPEGTITPGFAEEDSPITITATAEDSLANVGVGSGQIVITTTILALEPSRITSNSFRANWSSVVDAVSYTLEVSDLDDFSNLIVNENTTETSFDVEELDFETEYFYRATFDNGVDAPTTSDVVSLFTDIKDGTVDDFNSLLEIESATGGNSWTTPSNWNADTRKQDWDYIVLDNERIVELSIPGNNLTGSFPYTPLMTELGKIDVSDNELTGIEDLTRLRSINELDVSDNLFEFDDLEKLKDLSNFSYSPQKTVLAFNETATADSILVRIFSDPILSVPAKGEYITYDWFLNGNAIDTGDDFIKDDSLLNILSIDYDNMGKFKAEVRNDSLPDLTIEVDSMFAFAVADFSVDVNDENGTLIPDNVDGYLLLTTQGDRGFDTLSVAKNQLSSFTFSDVILGDYLISIDSDPEKYVPSYYTEVGEAFEWVDADTVQFRKDTAFQLSMTIIPEELTEEDGIGTLGVVIEEDFGDDAGRIDARRRAARRKCGLRRKTGGGRTDADDDGFELIAYGETNDNGEFEFGFLPEGTYRFFVEYPGIPLDESSFVEFEVGELGISETDFKLEAFASEDGIEVNIEKVLGVIFDYFKNLEVYPNPTSEVLKISYRHLAAKNVAAKLVDLSGNVLWTKDIRGGYDGYEEVDVSEFEMGMYILYVYDKTNSKGNVASYRIMVRD